MLSNLDTEQYIKEVLGNSSFVAIRSNQGGPRPDKPYATFLYTGNQKLGAASMHDYQETATTLSECISTARTPKLSIQFFTDTESQGLGDMSYESANDMAQRFEDSLISDRVKRYMREKGFSVLDVQSTLDLDNFLGDRWERRALVELTLNTTTKATNEIEFFEPPVTVKLSVVDFQYSLLSQDGFLILSEDGYIILSEY